MSKTAKAWVIVATALTVIGCAVFVTVMAILKWDFTALSTGKYVTNEHEIAEAFQSISVNTDTADIEFLPSSDSKCTVVCHEQEKVYHKVTVVDGVLKIELNDTRAWYEYIGIGFENSKITVYIPEGKYGFLKVDDSTGDVKVPDCFEFEGIDIAVSTGDVFCAAAASGAINISAYTGDIHVDGISAGALEISVSTGMVNTSKVICGGKTEINVSTGKVYLENVSCEEFSSHGSTGDIFLKNVIVEKKITIERSTGDVSLDISDAAEIFIATDTGDVIGALLTDKVFATNTGTGSVSVPDTVSGGRCEVSTSTGDIRITIVKD
ncbi:MAG: DUF4097 family beta strand repeat protein [Clostridia bacterium]|nr:DUF4097 family beta strand repeat protein [Clostridia bacterium]